jgi:hypothetical protein
MFPKVAGMLNKYVSVPEVSTLKKINDDTGIHSPNFLIKPCFKLPQSCKNNQLL